VRITGGTARGCTLAAPRSGTKRIRPTSDRTREALFSILGDRVCGSVVLDLFAGTGALGIEALSRGADRAVFVDRSRQALELVHDNLERCLPHPRAMLLQLDLSARSSGRKLCGRLPDNLAFDLVFLDPPYEKGLAQQVLQMVEKTGIVRAGGMVVAEEHRDAKMPDSCGSLALTDRRQYGDTGLWFYSRDARKPNES